MLNSVGFKTINSVCSDVTLNGSMSGVSSPAMAFQLFSEHSAAQRLRWWLDLTVFGQYQNGEASLLEIRFEVWKIYFQNSSEFEWLNNLNSTQFQFSSSPTINLTIMLSNFVNVGFNPQDALKCSDTSELQQIRASGDITLESVSISNHLFVMSSSGQNIAVTDTDFSGDFLYNAALYAGFVNLTGTTFRIMGNTSENNNALSNADTTQVLNCQFYNVTFINGAILSDYVTIQSSSFNLSSSDLRNATLHSHLGGKIFEHEGFHDLKLSNSSVWSHFDPALIIAFFSTWIAALRTFNLMDVFFMEESSVRIFKCGTGDIDTCIRFHRVERIFTDVITCNDLTRYHTDTLYQLQLSPLNDTADNVTAAVARVTQELIDALRKESSGQRGPAAMVFMEYKVYGLTITDANGTVVKTGARGSISPYPLEA
ncbi:hypothetical protein PROFUN_15327 [Planoprotostelium fungivorum]|uniref:Uncharacterized protein n=1 Tax=Planoprotostelium fungivorum TaxID=1890364 RepID=A0A2P6MWX2_9EUKA|nr:hypothetical protein PROFUN_15327 [Planoprotostelium fungivorum]